jgi:hypothetical protein
LPCGYSRPLRLRCLPFMCMFFANTSTGRYLPWHKFSTFSNQHSRRWWISLLTTLNMVHRQMGASKPTALCGENCSDHSGIWRPFACTIASSGSSLILYDQMKNHFWSYCTTRAEGDPLSCRKPWRRGVRPIQAGTSGCRPAHQPHRFTLSGWSRRLCCPISSWRVPYKTGSRRSVITGVATLRPTRTPGTWSRRPLYCTIHTSPSSIPVPTRNLITTKIPSVSMTVANLMPYTSYFHSRLIPCIFVIVPFHSMLIFVFAILSRL